MIKLNGIFPPLPTAFHDDESLATEKMQGNIKKLLNHSLAGFLILGSNGELVHLTEKEKFAVYEACRKVIPEDKIMIAGAGGMSTRETIGLCKAAGRLGADAVLVLNPFYYKGAMTKETLKAHYFAVAEASEVPVIVYNMPANSGLDMDADTLVALAGHENIIGLKDSGGNVTKMATVLSMVNPEFQLLAGSAGFLLPALSIGAVGGILALANIAPDRCINIYESFNRGNLAEAKAEQLNVVELNTAVTRKWGVPALKAAMDYLGLYGGPARRPLLPLQPEISHELYNLLDKKKIKTFV